MRKLLFAALLSAGLVLFSSMAYATPFAPGDEIFTGALCYDTASVLANGEILEENVVTIDRAFMKKFTEDIVQDGPPAYRRVLRHSTTPCFDSRIHNFVDGSIHVTLTKKMWEFTPPQHNNVPIEMWEATTDTGYKIYTWLRPRDADDPEV